MRSSLWAFLIAIAVGGISQFVKDPAWLGLALLYSAYAIALLAALGLARDIGLLSSAAALLRRSPRVGAQPADDSFPAKAAPRVPMPRAAGPAGPMPVLQDKPKNATSEAPDAVRGNNRAGSPTAK